MLQTSRWWFYMFMFLKSVGKGVMIDVCQLILFVGLFSEQNRCALLGAGQHVKAMWLPWCKPCAFVPENSKVWNMSRFLPSQVGPSKRMALCLKTNMLLPKIWKKMNQIDLGCLIIPVRESILQWDPWHHGVSGRLRRHYCSASHGWLAMRCISRIILVSDPM